MNTSTLIFALLLLFGMVFTANAGSGHDHGHSHGPSTQLDDKGALKAANSGLKQLVERKLPVEEIVLDDSWLNLPEESKSISKKGTGYYVVSFKNEAADKTVFILLSSAGDLYDVNFSGEFKGL